MSAADLRARLLKNNNKFRSRLVTVTVPGEDGAPDTQLTVKVKQPSVDERSQIQGAVTVKTDGTIEGSMSRVGALAIVLCVRDPDTDEPVFTVEDIDTLIGCPTGGWVDELSRAVSEVTAEAQNLAKK